MQNQNQNIQPDYGFIVNQQLPDAQKPKKSGKKKFILIGTGLAVIATLVAVGVTARVQNGVQPTAQTGEEVNNIASQHLTLVTEGKISESRQVLSNPDIISPEHYEFLWGKFIPSVYDLQACEVMATENGVAKVYCPYKKDPFQGAQLDYIIVNNKIDKIEVITNG